MGENPAVGVEERLVAALVEEPAVVADDGGEDADRNPLRDDESAEREQLPVPRAEGLYAARVRAQWTWMFPPESVPLAEKPLAVVMLNVSAVPGSPLSTTLITYVVPPATLSTAWP